MPALFGTDGVRGVANRDLTPELAFALGRAAATVISRGASGRPGLVVGRDTRSSGDMLAAAVAAGAASGGVDVADVGVLPTPGVAFLTVELGLAGGAVVSASHNPPEYNGIKFFSGDGMKLPDAVEDEMDRLVRGGDGLRPDGRGVGRIRPATEPVDRYVDHLTASTETRLDGMKVVADCAHGAAHVIAPRALRSLGADIEVIGAAPDGMNINVDVGATHPEAMADTVRTTGADAGVAFDGDADRALFADETGELIDGDQVIAACALAMKEDGLLPKDTVVVTVMANLGFKVAMEGAGITVLETAVGDRFVLEEMIRGGAGLGGEQSGHVIFLDRATTGDGILTAIRFLSLAARKGVPLSELAAAMHRYPQVLENVPASDPVAAADAPAVKGAVEAAERALGERGRVLVRASGTEPLVRVMVEAETEDEAQRHARALVEVVTEASHA
ncbi:MAG TPA: phosphoglucosamine mutase [Actinomycetota bacterium]|nr:phosphoglucosamine mutase [Actinomycetota bacterium]